MKVIICALMLISIGNISKSDTQIYEFSNNISPFKTDFCSFYPEKNLNQNLDWTECCVQHDLSYWRGGTQSEKIIADNELYVCVSNISRIDAYIMFLGVNIGGRKNLALPWHWGYGWVVPRSSKELKSWELEIVQISTPNLQKGFAEYYLDTNFQIKRLFLTSLNDYCLDIGLESIQSEIGEKLRFKLINKETLNVFNDYKNIFEVSYTIELINSHSKYNIKFETLEENSCSKEQTDLQLNMSVHLKKIIKID